MNIEVVCLGTGSTVPSKRKNHSGYLIKTDRHKILLDCGEGIQRQFKLAEEIPQRLTHVLLTHWHEDHTIGLVPLLKSMGMNSYSQILKIYGPKHTKEKIELFQRIYLPFKINIEIKEIDTGLVYEDKDIRIESQHMDHGMPTLAYKIIIKEVRRLDKAKLKKLKLPNSPLIGDLQRGKDITYNGKKVKSKDVTYMQEGKILTIILDTAMNNNAVNFAKDSDLLICESTYAANEEEQAKEYKHLTTEQAATIAKKSKSKKLALVHISEKHIHRIPQMLKEARKVFKNTVVPEDLDILKV
ncbi:MAG: ribonuclease Z [Nanoarchaeota archaeon]